MPRPKGTIPPAVRVRDNQRRARARQKELIEEMRGKIQEYEQQGVQASAELQRAARKVAWENVQLRKLLVGVGVGQEKIEEYLEQCKTHETGAEGLKLGLGPVQRMGNTVAASIENPVDASCLKTGETDQSQYQSLGFGSLDHINIDHLPHHGEPSHEDMAMVQPQGTSQPPEEGAYEQELEPGPRTDQQETSCVIAANIIAGMRWHTDPEETLAALGCNGSRECSVKNTTVFRVMDMS
ncbi:hypothetical protein P154DRAFT_572793 [Amniculicola lignicola CBS 123094]|uniref:BZIP domain-containing protein n=1 Tax=Amniculicola lignicola CBS 123094 TaxID=1392246 RepID=A0A6A5WRN6_9PLEO|nr:hypothetical protein P154DRAFT_572793 [Amniculicola lignicola CBS 123094]